MGNEKLPDHYQQDVTVPKALGRQDFHPETAGENIR